MNQKKVLKICLLITLSISANGFAQQPKSTAAILKKIANTKQKDLWGRVEGIPTFDAKRHSDGCSGGMSATYTKLEMLHPIFGKTLPWRQCCVVHDKVYYYAGSRTEKQQADTALKNCVSEIVGNKILGIVMQDAVFIGGVPYFPTTYRWGYGEDFRGTEQLPSN